MEFEVPEEIIRENKKLVGRFPFLRSGSVFENYDYAYTWLDGLPEGWRNSFAEQMCEEIQIVLEREGRVNKYILTCVEDKYGKLEWCAVGSTEEIDQIVERYKELSKDVCVKCGKQAEYIQKRWIVPYCGACAKALISFRDFIPIDEYEDGGDL